MNINKKFLVSFFAIITLFFGVWSYTQALGEQITVCAKRNGLVYVIGENFKKVDCHKNDQLLSWSMSGSQGPIGNTGPVGPQGIMGPQGENGNDGSNGVDGTNGVSGWEKVSGSMVSNGDGSKTSTATCPLGKKVIGGGYVQTTNYIFYVKANYPSSDTEWTVTGDGSNNSLSFNAYAICVIAN